MKESDSHLAVDELAAYHAGELSEAEEALVQDHLVGCSECARMLLDLDALRHGADPDEEAPEAEKEAFWQSLRPQLAQPAPAPAPLPFPPRRRVQIFQALAAILAVAVIGLGIQNASLRQTVGGLSQPDLGAPVRDLSATESRGGSAPAVVTLAPDDRSFTLILAPADPRDFSDYEVVLERNGEGEIWRGRGLAKNRYGTFSLILARRMTDAGDYTLRLFGIEETAKQNAGEYHFRIETQ